MERGQTCAHLVDRMMCATVAVFNAFLPSARIRVELRVLLSRE